MPDTHGLGRIYAPDARDRLYPIQLVLDRLPATRRTTPWKRPRVLDQKATGTCVGHGWRGWYEGEPTIHGPSLGPDAFAIYRRAILLDEWAENDAEEELPNDQLQSGSSVRAGAKAMLAAGLIGSYVWATKAVQVADYVTRQEGSPVVVGTRWYDGMWEPDPKTGRVRIQGAIAGGHCWVVNWWDGRLFECYSSWGEGWGVRDRYGVGGLFRLSAGQLGRLISEDGEACLGTELVVAPVATA